MKLYIDEFLELLSEGKDKAKLRKIKKDKEVILSMRWSRKEVLNEEESKNFVEIANTLRKEGIDCRFEEFSVEEALYASRKVNGWVNEIKNARVNGKELSQFEKFIYAYDIASQFTYKAEDKGESSYKSRDIIQVLNGDKIVCVGFSSILVNILRGLNICSGYADLYSTKGGSGHSACVVYLDDPKYGIKGFGLSDPTAGSPKHNIERGQTMRMSLVDFDRAKTFYETKMQLAFSNIDSDKDQAIRDTDREDLFLQSRVDEVELFRQEEFLRDFFNLKGKDRKRFLKLLKRQVDKTAKRHLDVTIYPHDTVEDWINFSFQTMFRMGGSLRERSARIPFELSKLIKMNASKEEIVAKFDHKIDELEAMNTHEKLCFVFGKDLIEAKRAEFEDSIKFSKIKKEMVATDIKDFGFYNEKQWDAIANAMKQVAIARGKSEEETLGLVAARKFGWEEDKEQIFVDLLGKEEDLSLAHLTKKVDEIASTKEKTETDGKSSDNKGSATTRVR